MIKNIILTSANENINVKGVLSLETTSSKTLVNLKTYNFSKSIAKFVLGLKCGADMFKVELFGDENYIINKPLNLNEKIRACVLKIENNKSEILIWGSNETNRVWQNSFLNDFENQSKSQNFLNSENFALSNQNDAQNIENDVINHGNCAFKGENFENNAENLNKKQNEIYSLSAENEKFEQENERNQNENVFQNVNESEKEKVFDNELENDENDFSDFETDEEIEKIVDQSLNNFAKFEEDDDENLQENLQNNKSEFLNSVEQQINELLNNYEEEKALEEIIPNSKFVKVSASGENFYIFGVIYENSEIKYIVYGIPGEFSVKPEDEYANFYQWLPLNTENPQGYGYYLMYQDAISGNQVEIILE